jgi:hypothetical protein
MVSVTVDNFPHAEGDFYFAAVFKRAKPLGKSSRCV